MIFSFELNNKQIEEREQILKYLKEISYLENSELGEYLQALIHIAGCQGCFGKEFETALAKEINTQYIHCKNHVKIVEREVTKTVIEKELEWEF